MCHVQWNGKIWNESVKGGVKQGDSEIFVIKEIKTKMAGANYIQ